MLKCVFTFSILEIFLRTHVFNILLLEQPTELQRKTEESRRMKSHLEKLHKEIEEARSSKTAKVRLKKRDSLTRPN